VNTNPAQHISATQDGALHEHPVISVGLSTIRIGSEKASPLVSKDGSMNSSSSNLKPTPPKESSSLNLYTTRQPMRALLRKIANFGVWHVVGQNFNRKQRREAARVYAKQAYSAITNYIPQEDCPQMVGWVMRQFEKLNHKIPDAPLPPKQRPVVIKRLEGEVDDASDR